MTRKHLLPALFVAFVLLGIFAATAVWVWLTYTGSRLTTNWPFLTANVAPPEVFILHPVETTGITSGQGLAVSAYAVSQAGVQRIDFLVDGQVEKQYAPQDTPPEVKVVFPWFGSQAGAHRLSVIAYDSHNQASPEAVVYVNVRAAGPLPVVASDDSDGSGNAGLSNGGGNGAPADAAPNGPQPPQAAPQDAPPVVDQFDVRANVAEDSTQAIIFGSAHDDLGLTKLKVVWHNNAGNAGDFNVECARQQICDVNTTVDLGPGVWLFAFQAVDTSGQSSPLKLDALEVIAQPGQPPAVAEHNDMGDWLNDRLIHGDFGILPAFDVNDILGGLLDAGAAPAGGQIAQANDRCLNLTAESRRGGNLITMRIECDLQVDGPDMILFPNISKSMVNTGDRGIDLFIPQWYDNQRTHLAPGDSFTWLDNDVTCGTTYRYSGRLDNAHVLDYHRNSFSAVSITANQAFASVQVGTPNCAPGSIADVNLRAAAAGDGIHIRWNVAANGHWTNDLPEDGVRFILTRFDSESGESLELYNELVPTDLLLAGGDFEALDDTARCGSTYWYSLAAIAADAHLDLVEPGWLLHAQVQGPVLPCAAQDIGSIQLHAAPYWYNAMNVRVRLQMQVPAGFAWPQGRDIKLEIVRIQQGADQCAGPPCLGIWQVKEIIPITEQIRTNGLNYEDDDTSAQFGARTYVYRLALVVDGQEAQSGPNVSVDMPPAPPPPPEITRLTATNNCPDGAPRCVIVEWQPYQQPSGGYYAQAARIAVERLVGAIDDQFFPVGLNETRFVDTHPFTQDFDRVDGTHVQICSYDTLYRMVAFDAQGHTYGASPLSLSTPDCNAPWNIVIEPPGR